MMFVSVTTKTECSDKDFKKEKKTKFSTTRTSLNEK